MAARYRFIIADVVFSMSVVYICLVLAKVLFLCGQIILD